MPGVPRFTVEEKEFTASPAPFCHGSNPAWTLVRYQLFCAMPRAMVFRTKSMTSKLQLATAEGATKEMTSLEPLLPLHTCQVRPPTEAVPACEYIVPSNATELLELAAALKAVELGVFMSLVESLPPADTLASTLLSSMASVAAKQNALLRARSVGAEPFDTPASAAWAYNLALGYARPGSCPVELPLPMLPSLVVNGGKVAHARPDTNVTFGWDAAGGAAAWRSGKPLSVGWVNGVDPPVYTVLTVLGDGTGQSGVPPGLSGTAFAVVTAQPGLDSIGELTAATLAGPVVVGLAL